MTTPMNTKPGAIVLLSKNDLHNWYFWGLHSPEEDWETACQSSPLKEADKDSPSSLGYMVGGSHYRKYKIQPIEYAMANKLNYCEANAIKYVTRHRDKNGAEDLRKAIHNLEILLELEYGEKVSEEHSVF